MKRTLCAALLLVVMAAHGQLRFDFAPGKSSRLVLRQSVSPDDIQVLTWLPPSPGLWKANESDLIRLSDSVLHRRSQLYQYTTYVDIDPIDSIGLAIQYGRPELTEQCEYRLRVDGSAGAGWMPIPTSDVPGDMKRQFGVIYGWKVVYIGKYRGALGSSLIVEVRRKGVDTLISSSVVLWREARPSVVGVFRQQDLKDFVAVMRDQGKRDVLYYTHDGPGKPIDSLLVKRTAFSSVENNLVFYLGERIHDKGDIEYSLTGPGGTGPGGTAPDSTTGWKPNDFDNNFLWLNNLTPGRYILRLRYRVQPDNVTEYAFEIRPAWYQTATFKIIAGSLITAFFALIVVLFRLRTKQQRVIQLELKNARTEARLASVKSQLNPHFIFNALSSIQGLVNKRELNEANQYLGDFGELLRKSLENNDMVSLDREMETLDTYLRLERLRFHFRYTLFVDPLVPQTEIPSLLLQPLVENAVKHGVSALRDGGEIDILVTKEDDGLIVYIRNNGMGFDPTTPPRGLGLKLTMERIALLRESGRDVVLRMDSEPGKHGTIAYVYFNHWL